MQYFRLLAHGRRRQSLDDMAVVDDVDAIGETHGRGDILLDDEDCLACGVKAKRASKWQRGRAR